MFGKWIAVTCAGVEQTSGLMDGRANTEKNETVTDKMEMEHEVTSEEITLYNRVRRQRNVLNHGTRTT
jgi:hypothetical protein